MTFSRLKILLPIASISLGLGCLLGAGSARAQSVPEEQVLTLEQAKDLARRNNPTLQTTAEKLLQAELMIDKAWVMVKPQLNGVGTYTHTQPSASLNFPDFQSIFDALSTDPAICGSDPVCVDWSLVQYSKTDIVKQDSFGLAFTLSQPLFLARAYSSIKNAYAGYELAKLNADNLEDFLLHTVELAYFGALTTQKFLQIAKHAVEIRAEHLKVARAKFEVGDQPKITVLRAEIDLNQAEQDVKRTENGLSLAKEAIGLLVGASPNFSLVAPTPPIRPGETMQAWIERALSERRDLAAAHKSLEIADRLKQDAWFRFLPSLMLTGMFRLTDTKGFTGEYYSWNVGLALSIPLYDGGLRYAYLDEAESKIREAQIQIEEKRRSIASEIRQLWLRLEMAEANLEKARQSVALAQEQADLAKISFDAGAITNLEVLDANNLLSITELGVAQEELNMQLAVLKLEKSVRMFNPAGSAAASGADTGAASAGGSSSMDMGASGGGEASGASSGGMGGM